MSDLALAGIGRSDSLGRYYTNSVVCDVLVAQMNLAKARCVIDLGVGAGSLSQAALKAFGDARLITVDIDPLARRRVHTVLSAVERGRHRHFRIDALNARLPSIVRASQPSVDAAVCNPPFLSPKWRKAYSNILEDVGFSGCFPAIADSTCAVLFLAQNIRLLDEHGTVGIILPDSLISSAKYRLFRRALLEHYRVASVTRLPRSSFQNTDALAHIVVLKKGVGPTLEVRLQELTDAGKLSLHKCVDPSSAEIRLDTRYHCTLQKSRSANGQRFVPLAMLTSKCTRGSFTSSQVKSASLQIVHTSNLNGKDSGSWCRFTTAKRVPKMFQNGQRAESGDILVSRVGRDLESGIIGVFSGLPFISDCVFILRVRKSWRRHVLRELVSERGKSWLSARVYGVGARQLTKRDLLEFPVREIK